MTEEKVIGFIDPKDIIEFIPDHGEIGEIPDESEEATFDVEEEEALEPQFLSEKKLSASIDEEMILKTREDTRGRLAIIYTISTFAIFLAGILIATLDGVLREVSIIDNLKEILPLISGIFLGSLGFVLGYYFRRGDF